MQKRERDREGGRGEGGKEREKERLREKWEGWVYNMKTNSKFGDVMINDVDLYPKYYFFMLLQNIILAPYNIRDYEV